MLKRIVSILLCLSLLCAFLPGSAVAMTNDQYRMRHKIMKQIQNMYQKILITTQLESTNGKCGLLVSWELYFLEINNYVVSLDGNQFYDTYAEMDKTDAGFPVHAYPAEEYSLEEALYTITKGGTEDVYNVMVGFQWTKTEAGQKYGHVCMIHAIIDGYVYFVEGFEIFGVPEGQPAVMDIESFSNYWTTWTEYEGTIYFGNQKAEDYCDYYGTDMYVQTLAPLYILDAPDHNATQLRKAPTGERLHAVGVYQAKDGSWFYKIDDGGTYSYMLAGNTEPIWMGYDDIRIAELSLPKKLDSGKGHNVRGRIKIPKSQLESIWINVTDPYGKVLMDKTLEKNGKYCNLKVEELVDLASLPDGSYSYNIYADMRNYYVVDGNLKFEANTVPVTSQNFTVGDAELVEVQELQQPQQMDTGWVLQDGIWYYFEEGKPRPGWFCSGGVNYYLKEDGSVSTGWVEINGINRFFSDTGALRTGWVDNDKETYYLLRNGVRATGWQNVEGGRYYLGDDGVLRKKGWLKVDDQLYYVDETGKACVGWVGLKEGRFSFHADGYLIARMVGNEIVPYEDDWTPRKTLN